MKQSQFDKEMLLMSDDIANFSKDPSTKVGAIIVMEDDDNPKSFGYNGMPRGLDDASLLRNDRPEKYFWYEHAERNAIYNLALDTLEGSMIFCSHFPNMDSARGIVSSGIKEVIVAYDMQFHEKYLKAKKEKSLDNNPDLKNYERVQDLFKETHVKLYQLSIKLAESGFFAENQEKESLSKLVKYKKYLDIAVKYGIKFSKDQENKSGALILDKKTLRPIALGAYAPPFGFNNMTEERNKEKSFWFISAEQNAIYNAVRRDIKNSSIYVSWCPCMHCSLAVTAVGIKKLVTRKLEFKTEAELRWQEHFVRSQQLFKEMNIETEFFSKQDLENL